MIKSEQAAKGMGPSVAIVGGGISGLLVATRLRQLGITNTVCFDTGKHAVGGRASTRTLVGQAVRCSVA
jgi:cation diffusion facilitator CzcD-associated flavoprotein CzcO